MNNNREIKFRAWDISNKMMLYPNTELPKITWYNCIVWLQLCHPYQHNYGLNRTPDDPNNFILMQFTGLKDKNGKEIYHKDILEWDGNKFIVEWENENGMWYGKPFADNKENGTLSGRAFCKCTKIGNEYEQ